MKSNALFFMQTDCDRHGDLAESQKNIAEQGSKIFVSEETILFMNQVEDIINSITDWILPIGKNHDIDQSICNSDIGITEISQNYFQLIISNFNINLTVRIKLFIIIMPATSCFLNLLFKLKLIN